MAATLVVGLICAASAHAAYYKLVLCAAGNGSTGYETRTNTSSPGNPNGIFKFENYCGPAGDPAGDAAFLRISENQDSGNAGDTAYGSISWNAPPWVGIAAAGGYTREPGNFNDGWRGRFWAEGYDGGTNNILMQGSGVGNGSLGGIGAGLTSTFASHLWPFGGLGDYRRFVFELTCMRPAGCDRSGWNGVDANTLVLILNDPSPVDLHLANTGSAPLNGQWVRGLQTASYVWSDQGSGIRWEWVEVDGARNFTLDHASECGVGNSQVNGEFAREFRPCSTASGIGRSDTFDTAALPDGAHTLRACGQDYAQSVGLYGTGGASCDQTTIRTDNSAPGAPAGLEVSSANPARYLPHLGAHWQLPPNQGSPIAAVHYDVVNAAGQEVMPTRTIPATDPTSLAGIEAPKAPGTYRLRLWLEDAVGFNGAAATAPIPHDTTPPAAPQNLAAIGPDSWGPAQGYRLRWDNLPDNGSPITVTRYQVLDAAGKVAVATKTLSGEGISAVPALEIPRQPGDYSARVWLEDEEGNVGAPATAAIPRDTTPPAAPQDLSVTAPGVSRAEQGFDVRWRNVPGSGSPILAARYEVLGADGSVVVSPRTVPGEGIRSIDDLDTPTRRGTFTLKLWLVDAEGNEGAPTSAPLAYECVRSEASGARGLSVVVNRPAGASPVLSEGEGALLTGKLRGDSDLASAPVCVFDRVVTEADRQFLGVAMTDKGGGFSFGLAGGPSRELTAISRAGQREVSDTTTVRTQVRPVLELGSKVVRGRRFATFTGAVPGPDSDGVLVVLQVRDSNDHWRAFRRYLTRDGGHYSLRYRFVRTPRPTTYPVRAQVRGQASYPYEPGNSLTRKLRVIP
ncbi:MAG: hypothetical protein ABW065_09565 [Solirubrobacterales bacterium]